MPGGYYPDTKISGRRSSNQAVVHADGSFLVSPVPESYRFYFHTIFDQPGVVAANNFMSIFNPVGSGKTVAFFSININSYAVGATSVGASLLVDRITAASGGSLVAAADVNRLLTSWPNPVAEVRTGNPSATKTGLTLFSWVPPLAVGAGEGATTYSAPPAGQSFICLPGQGIVLSTSAGDIDQRWGINANWAEF